MGMLESKSEDASDLQLPGEAVYPAVQQNVLPCSLHGPPHYEHCGGSLLLPQRLLVERVDGVTVLEAGRSDAAEALAVAGFARTPRGLRLR